MEPTEVSSGPTMGSWGGLTIRDHFAPGILEEIAEDRERNPFPPPPRRYAEALIPTTDPVRAWLTSIMDNVRIRYAGTKEKPAFNIPKWCGGDSLLLLGPTGTGKTYEAYAAYSMLTRARVRGTVVFVTAAQLYAALRPHPGSDFERDLRRFTEAQILILDDIGAAKGSEWVDEINYRLINHRYEHVLPTMITSNVPPGQLADIVGERVFSRLTEMCVQAVLKGQDRRRK